MSAKNIRMFSFYIPREDDPKDHRNAVIDRLSKMAEVAEGSGITLCHENEKGIYGDNAERCLDILESVPSIAGVFDPANFVQSGVDTIKAWKILKDRTKYLHIKDALADGRVVPAGKGIGNVAEIVSEYAAAGGFAMTVEPHLSVFKGLSELEQEGGRSHVGETYTYPSADEAFDAACDAIKAILEEKRA